ncbi:hypothetical protein J3454_14285 [Erythrobacter sp. NFXS35]|uniref:hypothetical protein n=1 Tax=Erythrobacter sp. NFXS35 TaxID=2818436 RepID=UPI0032DF87BA
MPFETIENVSRIASQIAVFSDGVRVEGRTLKRKGGALVRYIKVTVGARLAAKLVWRNEAQRIDLAFGTGRDGGKIRASTNVSSGQFVAKRDQQGRYTFTINASTADGLFALEFPTFDIEDVEPVCERNVPPALVFSASEPMLAVD